jgi:hypothetical protein
MSTCSRSFTSAGFSDCGACGRRRAALWPPIRDEERELDKPWKAGCRRFYTFSSSLAPPRYIYEYIYIYIVSIPSRVPLLRLEGAGPSHGHGPSRCVRGGADNPGSGPAGRRQITFKEGIVMGYIQRSKYEVRFLPPPPPPHPFPFPVPFPASPPPPLPSSPGFLSPPNPPQPLPPPLACELAPKQWPPSPSCKRHMHARPYRRHCRFCPLLDVIYIYIYILFVCV